jgi:hypothetical protein
MDTILQTLKSDGVASFVWALVLFATGRLAGVTQICVAAGSICVYLQLCRAFFAVLRFCVWEHAPQRWHGSVFAVSVAVVYGVVYTIQVISQGEDEGGPVIKDALLCVLPPAIAVAVWDLIRAESP